MKYISAFLKDLVKDLTYDLIKQFIVENITPLLISSWTTFSLFLYGYVEKKIGQNMIILIAIFFILYNLILFYFCFKDKRNKKEKLSEFIPLKEVVLKLTESEQPEVIKEIEELAISFGFSTKKYTYDYYLEKYLKNNLFGTKVDSVDDSKKVLIPSIQVGWDKDYCSIISSNDVVLYKDICVKRDFFEKLLGKQKNDIFQESL